MPDLAGVGWATSVESTYETYGTRTMTSPYGVGYTTSTGFHTVTTWLPTYEFTIYSRALQTQALLEPSGCRGSAPAPTPTPAPSSPSVLEKGVDSRHERHELVKRRGGGGGGGGGGGASNEDVDRAFLYNVPQFLGLFWSFAVILWLLILPCKSSSSGPRSIASMQKTLMWLGIIGLACSLYSSIASGVEKSRERIIWGISIVTLVFAWLTTITLFAIWIWLRLWARKNAHGMLQRSVEDVEESNGANSVGVVGPSSPDGKEEPATLELAYSSTGYLAPPPPGTGTGVQTHNQPLSQPYVQPASLPPAPAGYTYALIPAASVNTVPPSPPPTTHPANMYQSQPVQGQGPNYH